MCFAQPQQGDTGPRMGKKITNLNVKGQESATLEEVREAWLPTTHTLPEHVRAGRQHLQLNYDIMNAWFTCLAMDIWQCIIGNGHLWV